MQELFFTADTHFFHKKIFGFCPKTRQGNSIEEMNEILIRNWNNRVSSKDLVYHLGDFSFGDKTDTAEVLSQLNGQIHLIRGNHDGMFDSGILKGFLRSYQSYKEIRFHSKKLCLMHFPIESWNGKDHGSIHLHGHLHGGRSHVLNTHFGIDKMKNRMDVGIDTRNDMSPWHIDEILSHLKERDGS